MPGLPAVRLRAIATNVRSDPVSGYRIVRRADTRYADAAAVVAGDQVTEASTAVADQVGMSGLVQQHAFSAIPERQDAIDLKADQVVGDLIGCAAVPAQPESRSAVSRDEIPGGVDIVADPVVVRAAGQQNAARVVRCRRSAVDVGADDIPQNLVIVSAAGDNDTEPRISGDEIRPTRERTPDDIAVRPR